METYITYDQEQSSCVLSDRAIYGYWGCISSCSVYRVLQALPPMAFLHSVWNAIIYNVSLLFTIM